jgi:hypothetical protein
MDLLANDRHLAWQKVRISGVPIDLLDLRLLLTQNLRGEKPQASRLQKVRLAQQTLKTSG